MAPRAAEAAGSILKLDPLIIVAQAALESGWGAHTPKRDDGGESWNFFGIKSAAPPWAGAWTKEFIRSHYVTVHAHFAAYQTMEDGFLAYAHFIQINPRYAPALRYVSSPELYVRGLQEAGYATDPHYADKVIEIYRELRRP